MFNNTTPKRKIFSRIWIAILNAFDQGILHPICATNSWNMAKKSNFDIQKVPRGLVGSEVWFLWAGRKQFPRQWLHPIACLGSKLKITLSTKMEWYENNNKFIPYHILYIRKFPVFSPFGGKFYFISHFPSFYFPYGKCNV